MEQIPAKSVIQTSLENFKNSTFKTSHRWVLPTDFSVSAPSEAWRILRGASPRLVRPSQSPVSSVACMAEALLGNLVGIAQILKGHWESAGPTIHHERHRISEQDT